MAHTGTLAWAHQTGGRLDRDARLRLTAQAVLFRLRALPDAVRERLGVGALPFRVDLDAVRVPDTTVARAVRAHVGAVSPPWLAGHCERTFLWAAVLAARDGVRHDAELLYAACLLHDLGLVERHRGTYPAAACFAVEGAFAARDLDAVAAWEAERRDRLAEAIALHLNVVVALGDGPEAHLLHAGAALDTVGARARQVHPATRAAVLARQPRVGLVPALVPQMAAEARMRPDSRTALLCGLGFIGMLRRSPLPDGAPLAADAVR